MCKYKKVNYLDVFPMAKAGHNGGLDFIQEDATAQVNDVVYWPFVLT